MSEKTRTQPTLLEAHTAVELAMEGISKLDDAGRYVYVNGPYAALLGYQPEELIGQSWEITVHPEDRRGVLAVFEQMLVVGRAEAELRGLHKDGRTIYKHVVIVKPDGATGKVTGHYCFARDITERKQAEQAQLESQRLLEAITRIQSRFIDDEQPEAVWALLLEELLRLTQSEYGFIGEIVQSAEGLPVLRSQAITNIAWNEESRALLARLAPNLEFKNLKTLFGHVMTTGQPVIANDPAHDPRAGGLPPGHPPMHAFLGLPFFRRETLTGMVGIANRPGGYDERLVTYLQPFLATCAQLLEGYRSRRLKSEAEEALRASEERWQLAVKGSNDGIWDWDLLTHRVFYSPRWREMRGLQEGDLAESEEEWRTRVHPDDWPRVWEQLQAYFEKRTPEFHEEYRTLRSDGSYMWVLDRGVAVWDKEGRPVRMAGSETDITERKREEMFQAAEKQALEMVATGASLKEVLLFLCMAIESHTAPMRCAIMLVSEDKQHLRSTAAPSLPDDYNQAVDGIPIGPTVGSCGSAAYFGKPSIVADIASHPLWEHYAQLALTHGLKACWSQPILSPAGTVLGTFAAYYGEVREPQPLDLTVVSRASRIASLAIEHVRALQALKESEERFRVIADSAPALIWMAGTDKRCSYFNACWLDYTGRTMEQELGDGWAEGVHQADRERCWSIYSNAFDRHEPFSMEYRLRRADGQYGWIHDNGAPRFLPDGTFAGYLGACIDITARKQAEAARETLQYAVDHGMEGIALLDSEGRYTYLNEAHANIYGFSASELIGRSWKTLYDEDQTVWIEATAIAAMQADRRWSGELVGRTKTGAVIHAEVGLQLLPQRGDVPQGFLCTCRDITTRKKAEESLQRTQFAMDQAVDAVYWIDAQAKILYTNEAASAMLGYAADEFLTMTVHDLNPDFPPERWPGWWEETRAKKEVSFEATHLSKDGRRIPIDIRVSFLAHGDEEFHCAFVRDISKRKEAEEAAYRSFSLLQSVLHAAPIRVFWKDRALRYLGCNRQFALDAGCADAKEIVGKRDDELVWHQQAALYQADDRLVMESGLAKLDFDKPGTTREGKSSWLRTSKVPLRDEQGDVIGVLGVYEDVTERKRMETALDALARGTGAVIGHEFFPVFVKELAQALQVCCAGVCDLFQERPGYAKVRAMWNGDGWMPPFEYALASTPCGQVVRDGFASFPSSVQELFPEDRDLVTLRAESYMGFLLRSGSGEPMGHIFMIDDRPLADAKQVMAIMQIFAARAAAEMERIKADDALRASQERFALAVRASNDGIWDWNVLTGEQYWSDRHFELFGLEPQAFAPTYDTWMSFLHPEDADQVRHATERHLDAREPYDVEVRVRMKDGGYRWFHDQGQAVWDPTGRPVRMVGSISDVTERKSAQAQLEQHVTERTAALRRSEQRYATLVNSVEGIILEFDPVAARTTFVSQQAERIIGYPVESWINEPLFFETLLHPDDRARVIAYCADMTKRGLNHEMEYRMVGSDGRIIWIRDVVSLMYADDGTVKLCSILMDVTRQRELRNRLQLTQFTVDRAAQGIFWVGPNAEILYVNEAACRVLGYSRAELLTMTVHDVDPNFPPEIWPSHWEELKQRGSFTFESSQLTKDGRVRYTEITVNYLEYDGREYNCANVRDITERKIAANAVRDSELRYKLLTEATFDGIAIHDHGVLLEVNSGLERMFGYEPGELIGRSLWDLVAEDSRDLVLSNMRSGVIGPYEATGLRKDGTTFPGEVVVRPYVYQGKDVRLVAGRDITERKRLQAELARYTEELERQVAERTTQLAKLEAHRAQVEKLAAMGRLAAGVAHEINNPLAGIKNAFTLVRQAVDPAHPNAEFAGLIDREIARVASIIQNMYQLCQPETRKAETVDLWSLVKDLDGLLTPQLQQRRLKLVVDMGPRSQLICVPRGDLVQVLLNLLTNAIDCSPEGGTILFTSREETDGVRLSVKDQGPGIVQEQLTQIFDPFYTTKTNRDQKGMGLGLSISQSLVQAMGGRIEVDTQVQRGSTFTVVLPHPPRGVSASDQSNIIKEVVTHDC